jgi:copper oxidase (laccase) domain-containing protein
VNQKLSLLGIENIQKINEDTYSTKLANGKHKYPSFRRHTHKAEDYPVSIITGIMIRK